MFLGLKEAFIDVYDKKYKELMILTIVILFLAIGVLAYNYFATGEFIKKGVSLSGGIELTIPIFKQVDTTELERSIVKASPESDVSVRSISEFGNPKSLIVEASNIDEKTLLDLLKNAGFSLRDGEYTSVNLGSALGSQFFKQMVIAVIFAFLAMSAVVLITFRVLVPSLFVILAAASDILITLAIVSLLGVKLSMSGIGAFLMLIGYSVDTDILLTTRVLKRTEGTILDRTLGAMRTGLAMSLTSFVAVVIGYIVTPSDLIKQMMLILAIGLFFDILNTWVQNAGILRWYLEWKANKEGKKHE